MYLLNKLTTDFMIPVYFISPMQTIADATFRRGLLFIRAHWLVGRVFTRRNGRGARNRTRTELLNHSAKIKMVFESMLVDILNRYLRPYVKRLDPSQIKVGVWKGEGRTPALLLYPH